VPQGQTADSAHMCFARKSISRQLSIISPVRCKRKLTGEWNVKQYQNKNKIKRKTKPKRRVEYTAGSFIHWEQAHASCNPPWITSM